MEERQKLVPVWRFQWIETGRLREWQTEGTLLMTPAKFERIVQDAQVHGFEQGEIRGRYNLRRDIESGEVEPIKGPPHAFKADELSKRPADTCVECGQEWPCDYTQYRGHVARSAWEDPGV